MTPTEYINAGFKVSTLLSQSELTKAETEITAAYLTPIAPELTTTNSIYKNALMNLTFLLLLKRDNAFVTRAGSKKKNTPTNSEDSSMWDDLINVSTACHLALVNLRNVEGVNKDAKVLDICGIYFKSNYISF